MDGQKLVCGIPIHGSSFTLHVVSIENEELGLAVSSKYFTISKQTLFFGSNHAYTMVSQGSLASRNQPKSHHGSQGQLYPTRWVGYPQGLTLLLLAPSPPPPARCATPPISRVTRLRRVQRWLAPSPIIPSTAPTLSFCLQILSHPLYSTNHPGAPTFDPELSMN